MTLRMNAFPSAGRLFLSAGPFIGPAPACRLAVLRDRAWPAPGVGSLAPAGLRDCSGMVHHAAPAQASQSADQVSAETKKPHFRKARGVLKGPCGATRVAIPWGPQ